MVNSNMQIIKNGSVLKCSGLRLTMTASSAVGQHGAGDYAIWGEHSREGASEKNIRSLEVRIGTLNVGSMTFKRRELADHMER